MALSPANHSYYHCAIGKMEIFINTVRHMKIPQRAVIAHDILQLRKPRKVVSHKSGLIFLNCCFAFSLVFIVVVAYDNLLMLNQKI